MLHTPEKTAFILSTKFYCKLQTIKMSEYFVVIDKTEASKIIDFQKNCFYTENTKKSKDESESYSKLLAKKINGKFKIYILRLMLEVTLAKRK